MCLRGTNHIHHWLWRSSQHRKKGCKFTLNRKMANGKKYWRCAKRICLARITTEGNEVLQQTNGHNHPVDGVEAEVERVEEARRSPLFLPSTMMQ